MKKAKNQRKQYIENSVEAKRDTNDVLGSAVSTAKDFAGDFWKQVLGIEKRQKFESQGERKPPRIKCILVGEMI